LYSGRIQKHPSEHPPGGGRGAAQRRAQQGSTAARPKEIKRGSRQQAQQGQASTDPTPAAIDNLGKKKNRDELLIKNYKVYL
jgi:hypothetical protein